jgi:hypothetical protein
MVFYMAAFSWQAICKLGKLPQQRTPIDLGSQVPPLFRSKTN